MKFEIEYELTVVRKMIVEADTKEEARKKYSKGEYIDDWEEDTVNDRIIDIQEEE